MEKKLSAEEILDKHYKHGMHWNAFNRKNVLNAMKKYASQFSSTKTDEGWKQEISLTIELWEQIAEKAFVAGRSKQSWESFKQEYLNGNT
jgi:DNA-binding transcriptional regulator GbsR (MarR family)